MKKTRFTAGVVGLLATIALIAPSVGTTTAQASVYSRLNKIQKRILSGFATTELTRQSATSARAGRLTPAAAGVLGGASYFPTVNGGCPRHLGPNVKVNQNCLNLTDPDLQGRGQAQNETAIAQNPKKPTHLLATWNDYRRGDANCIGAYSLNNGRTWNDVIPPTGFTRGANFGGVARQYWQANGDTAAAWDSKGNAYFLCMAFMRGLGVTNNPDQSSAVYVFRSTLNQGASFNFTARPVIEFNDVAGTGCCLIDKPYFTVDNHVGSPFQDRIYVTWTFFDGDGTAYIFEAHSNDYGETFSSPVLVSTDSPTLCTNTFGLPTPNGSCNENQFSQPFTGPDGNLYVVFDNYNNTVTGLDNRNQILLTKSIDGGVTFGAPVKVSDFYDLPDCPTYQGGQDPGRACVPEKGAQMDSVFRAANYSVGGVNPKNANQIAVTVGSYINKSSNETRPNPCTPDGLAGDGQNKFMGVKTAGACNNGIMLSVSNDGGATFTGTTTDPRSLSEVTQGKGQTTTDQWWQWAAFTGNGRFAVAYYDRQYGNDETNGNMDFSLSGSKNLASFKSVRVTSSSMPLPTQFPNGLGNSVFFGDYAGLSVTGSTAHPLWMDTRDVDLFLCPGTGLPGVPPAVCTATEPNGRQANDQDIFSRTLGIP
jgi:hypothetical protein